MRQSFFFPGPRWINENFLRLNHAREQSRKTPRLTWGRKKNQAKLQITHSSTLLKRKLLQALSVVERGGRGENPKAGVRARAKSGQTSPGACTHFSLEGKKLKQAAICKSKAVKKKGALSAAAGISHRKNASVVASASGSRNCVCFFS